MARLRLKDAKRLFRVDHPKRFRLKEVDPRWHGDGELPDLTRSELKSRAVTFLQENTASLAAAQERLYAADSHSVLIVLQAMDAAGKDGAIKHVMSGINPQGCQVCAFKQPSREELDHDFLWRYAKALPERGRIGIFNRSYYEDVLVVRVHRELLQAQRLPRADGSARFWADRFGSINDFEQHLVKNGTVILKFFLHLSRREQKQRFKERLEDPDKHWKFSFDDLTEREYWKQYQEAFEEMLRHTSTPWAPWWVIPADYKWVTRALIAAVITDAIDDVSPAFPEVSEQQRRLIVKASRMLGVQQRRPPAPRQA